MAITKETTILGLTAPNAYYNIQEATTEKQEDGTYIVDLLVNEYTDSSKENHVSQVEYDFDGVAEADLTYPNFYALLKGLEVFANSTDV
jgi:hypothetical protein